MVGRGLARRCPRCGAGGLFRSWFALRARCPRCRLLLDRGDAFFLGAFVINFGVTEAVLGLAIAVMVAVTLPDPPLVTLAAVAAAVTVVVPFAFYPFAQTLWLALEMVMRPPLPDWAPPEPGRPEAQQPGGNRGGAQ